jgi:hypothetical protein
VPGASVAAIRDRRRPLTIALDGITITDFPSALDEPFIFPDPDDNIIEFCAWLPAYDQIGRDHEPAGKSKAVGIRSKEVTPVRGIAACRSHYLRGRQGSFPHLRESV